MYQPTMTHHAATTLQRPQRLQALARSYGMAVRPFTVRRANCKRQLPAVVRAEGEKQAQEAPKPPPVRLLGRLPSPLPNSKALQAT
jgi:hypothetical protein